MSIFDLSSIYNEKFSYSLPKNSVESYISGKAFDNKEGYTKEEVQLLEADVDGLYKAIVLPKSRQTGWANVMAGSPGVGKTVLLNTLRDAEAKLSEEYVPYVCPDDVCLRNMEKTYTAELNGTDRTKENMKKAYDKWRPGSNAALNIILAHLIREKFDFYYGTTSASPFTHLFYKFLKDQGYKIRVIHLSAPDDVRWGSIQERDKTFVQTTEEDIINKGKDVPQRIMDTFLKYADEIQFYYRDGVHTQAKHAATWTRNEDQSKALGTLKKIDSEQYDNIKKVHNKIVEALNKPELVWEKTVDKNSL